MNIIVNTNKLYTNVIVVVYIYNYIYIICECKHSYINGVIMGIIFLMTNTGRI